MSYLWQVFKHKWFLIVAGLRVGGIPFYRLLIHDWTKFLPVEFIPYRKKFTLKNCPKEQWEKAWEHHWKNNAHHWQFWVVGNQPFDMGESYAREMVADWLAASRGYHNHWNIQAWLDANFKKMNLHPWTIRRLNKILIEQNVRSPWTDL